jgi:transposase InsO family protein
MKERTLCTALVEEAVVGGCRREQACEDLGVSIRTVERWAGRPEGDERHGPLTAPSNKLTQEERTLVIEVATSPLYRDQSPSQIVPRLADLGVYVASESSFYRILAAEKMLTHRQASRPATCHRPEALTATAPNQVWSWDITYMRSLVAGMFFYLYLTLDVFSRKIVAWEVYEKESSDYAADLVGRACADEGIAGPGLVLHSDNGGPMKGATMLATLQRLCVIASFSRPSVSDDNPYSEALFRTLKYRPGYPSKPFATAEEARAWVEGFVRWYNTEHLHSGIRFVTPHDRHQGLDAEILLQRKATYELAKKKNPSRWSRTTRNWEPVKTVFLNPLKEEQISATKMAA